MRNRVAHPLDDRLGRRLHAARFEQAGYSTHDERRFSNTRS
jgi:hypothetical protein